MPTYEYECPRCPRIFEVKQRITEPALSTCDRCHGPIHRLLSAAPFILKGGGWYVTDYPSDARKKATGSESGSKDSTSKDSGSKDSGSKDSTTSKDPASKQPAKDGGSAESKPAASSKSKSSTESSTGSASSTGKPASGS